MKTPHLSCLFITLLALTASTFAATLEERAARIVIALNLKDASATDALKRIESLSGIKIKFTPPANDTAKITVSLRNIPVTEALKYVTGLANLRFKYGADAVEVAPIEQAKP